MRGSVHAAIGASAPVGLVLTGHAALVQGLVMSAVSAGFALLPDLDHPNACATKALGTPVHKAVHGLCAAVVQATATGHDRSYLAWKQARKRDPYHRTLTHTAVSAAVMGAAGFLSVLSGDISTGFMAAFGVFLLWPLWSKSIGLVVLGAAMSAVGAALLLDPWLMALAVGGGYATHIAADGCTAAGVPALWPLAVRTTDANGATRRKRWWNVRLLGGTVTSGSLEERVPAVGVAMASNVLLVLLTL